MHPFSTIVEALLLGLASGPACIGACGPVLVPTLLSAEKGAAVISRKLSLFLLMRLLGYVTFATCAWTITSSIRLSASAQVLVTGTVDLALAVTLLLYAAALWHRRRESPLVQIRAAEAYDLGSVLGLGFLTGLSLCPPFVIAALRAAQLPSLAWAVFFFFLFFVGTTVWFLPAIGIGFIRRTEAVVFVSRVTLVLVALVYGARGGALLLGRSLHGS